MRSKEKVEEALSKEESHLSSVISNHSYNSYDESFDSDVAYIEGWIEGLKWVLEGEDAKEETGDISRSLESPTGLYPIQGNLFDGLES